MGMTLSGRGHSLFTKLSPSILELAITKDSAEAAPIHLDLPTRRQLLQTASSPSSVPLLPVWKAHLPRAAGSPPAAAGRSPRLPASSCASQPAWAEHGSSAPLAASPALWPENRACSPVPFLLLWPSLFPVLTAFKRKMQRIVLQTPGMLYKVPGLPQACETALQHPLRPATGQSQEFGTLHVLHALTGFCSAQPWVPAASGIEPKTVQVTNCWQIQIDSNYMKFAEVQMRPQNSRKWKIRKSVTETRFQVFSITVPFTPCSRHILFYGLGMCDCTTETDKIYGEFVISRMDSEATGLGRRECLELAGMLCSVEINRQLQNRPKHKSWSGAEISQTSNNKSALLYSCAICRGSVSKEWDCQCCTDLEVTALSPQVFQMEDDDAVTAPPYREG